ncbi:MAG: ABC transporter permease [Dehalococcoidia bacterium]
MNKNKLIDSIPSILIVVAIFILWEVLVNIQNIPDWLLPPPSEIFKSLYLDFSKLLGHTLVTLQEILIGFFVALIFGFAIASAIGLSNTVEKSLYPFLISLQTIPIIVIAPMLLVWVGYGLLPKIIVVALISFFPIVVNTADGMKSLDTDMKKLLLTMGASKWQIFRKIMVPSSLPYLFSGVRIAVSLSVIGAVIGEWVGSSEGLGYLMIRSKPQFLTELVFASIFILSAIGIGLFLLVGILEKLIIPWYRFENFKE